MRGEKFFVTLPRFLAKHLLINLFLTIYEQVRNRFHFDSRLTDNGGTIENEENWGLRKLAYPIENKNTGFYTLIEFNGEPTIVAKLETAFRRDEKVIRFLTFRLDKYAAEYAVKRRAVRKAKQEERAAQEAAAQEAPVAEEAPKADAPAAEA